MITLVDHGADAASGGGDDSQHTVTYNAANDNQIAGGQWTDLEIKLADLTDLSSTADIGQIVISSQTDGAASGETLYLDNIYLGKTFSGLDFSETDLTANGSEGAFIPPMVEQSDGNKVLGLLKGGVYSRRSRDRHQ